LVFANLIFLKIFSIFIVFDYGFVQGSLNSPFCNVLK
jgi:hypothetical protein